LTVCKPKQRRLCGRSSGVTSDDGCQLAGGTPRTEQHVNRGIGGRVLSAVVLLLCVSVAIRVADWLLAPELPVLIGLGVVFAVATGLVRRQ
jgi:hypothetical protein